MDVRTGNAFTHFARRITAGGLADSTWVPSPTATCVGSTELVRQAVAPDGAGGTYVAWVDTRAGDADITLQRFEAGGAIATGWPSGGFIVAGGPAFQDDPSIFATSSGVYVLWHQMGRLTAGDIYLQRVTGAADVAPEWPVLGRVLCAESHDQAGPRLASDGAGGVLAVWQDRRRGILELYGTRVDSTGAIHPEWDEQGELLASLPGNAESPTTALGGTAAVVVWRQVEEAGPSRLLALPIPLAAGPPSTSQLLELAASVGALSDVAVLPDSAGVVVAWAEQGSASGVRAQRLTVTGSTLIPTWSSGGTLVGSGTPGLNAPQLVSDGSGGYLAAWEDFGSEESNVCAQRLTASGGVADGWSAAGIAVANDAGEQYAPRLSSDGTGGAVVTWSDAAQQEATGLFALTAAGVRLEVRLLRALATPGKVRIKWQALLPPVEQLRVDRRIGEEAWAAFGVASVGDSQQVALEDAGAPEGQQVSYRLVARIDGAEYHFRPVELQVPVAPLRLELRWIRGSGPRAITLACAIPCGGQPSLEVFDVAGRRMFERKLTLEPGEHTISVTTPGRMHSGVYFVRLRQDREVRQAKLVFVR